jgi:ketol-acid reductoisomerase
MARKFYERDGDLSVLAGRTVAIVGYGNQGRAQAMNLRDSGVDVVVGSVDDKYRERSEADGFAPTSIADAVRRADIVLMLIPDEIQPRVFEADVDANLRPDAALGFASGYNVFYGLVKPTVPRDVFMVAPRMIGSAVRSLFEAGEGFPSFVAVHQDVSGRAMDVALAIAKGIGGLRAGALESTFEEETVLDLYLEQVLGPGGMASLLASFELLTEAGYDPEVVQMELYGSGEGVHIAEAKYRKGLLHSLYHESPTARFGHVKRLTTMLPKLADNKAAYTKTLSELRDGTFAREWSGSEEPGEARIQPLFDAIVQHPMFTYERKNRELIFGSSEDQE